MSSLKGQVEYRIEGVVHSSADNGVLAAPFGNTEHWTSYVVFVTSLNMNLPVSSVSAMHKQLHFSGQSEKVLKKVKDINISTEGKELVQQLGSRNNLMCKMFAAQL